MATLIFNEKCNDDKDKLKSEYFSGDDNDVLTKIFSNLNLVSITKNSRSLKFIFFVNGLERIKNESEDCIKKKNINMTINIANLEPKSEYQNRGLTSEELINCINPNIFLETSCVVKGLRKINIMLSKITGKIDIYAKQNNQSNQRSIKFSYNNKNLEYMFTKDYKVLPFKRFLKNNKLNVESNYLELVYYVIELIKNLVNKKEYTLGSRIDKDSNFYNDTLGVYNEYKRFDKSNMNYEKLITVLNDKKEKEVKSQSEISIKAIPKEMLQSRKQIANILINQFKSINQNKNYLHFINTIQNDSTETEEINDPFSFELNLLTVSNHKIKIIVTINPDLHPFYPPKLKIVEPNVKLNLAATISNLDILKLENWSPNITFECLFLNLANNLENIGEYICSDDELSVVEKDIMELALLNGEEFNQIKFEWNLKLSKYKLNDENSNDSKWWKSGVGYGTTGRNDWDLKEYIKNNENKNILKSNKLDLIVNNLKIKSNLNLQKLLTSGSRTVLTFIENNINHTSLLEINKSVELYKSILNAIPILFSVLDNKEFKWKHTICKGLEIINDEISIIINSSDDADKIQYYVNFISVFDELKEEYKSLSYLVLKENDEKSTNFLFNDVISPMNKLNNNSQNPFDSTQSNANDILSSPNRKAQYKKMVNDQQQDIFNYKVPESHRFINKIKNSKITKKSIVRISSEVSSLKTNLPNNWDTSVIFRTSSNNINLITFIITGPKDTPYHNGIFEFHGYLPEDYPSTEPKILLDTTGNGSVRFNPNLYNCGKVCLSLLGTWQGNGAEKWNSSSSTLLQVIVSIQSLILVENPYFNEPGYEKNMHSNEGKRKSYNYTENIRIQTIKWAIIDKIKNPPQGFEEFTKNHFNLKKLEILDVIKDWMNDTEDKKVLDIYKSYQRELISLFENKDVKSMDDLNQKESGQSDEQNVSNDSWDLPIKSSLISEIPLDSSSSEGKPLLENEGDSSEEKQMFEPMTPPYSPPSSP